MRLLRAASVTDATLVSTDVPETDHPVWSSGATYAADALVIVTTSGVHKKYKSLQAGNLNHPPQTSDTWWVYQGPTNTWALFDGSIGTQTSRAGSFTYTLQLAGIVDTAAFLNADASSISVQVSVPVDGVVFDRTISMIQTSGITDWYAYYFEELVKKKNEIVLNLPSVLNPTITITVNNPTGTASLGVLLLGRQKYIGRTQYGASLGITDFSKKEEDPFGGYTVLERAYRNRGSFNVMIENNTVDSLVNMLAGYRATPILYWGSDEFSTSAIYGFYKDFSIVIQYFNESQCSIELEGLV